MRRWGLQQHGDPRAFYRLPREAQVDAFAIWQLDAEDAEKAARKAGAP